MSHPDSQPDDRDAAVDVREAIRHAREAAREQARQTRETAREQAGLARASLKDTIRQAREAHRGSTQDVRDARRGAAADEPDTRTRIQQVAIELFTDHGYEGTSLREIAERLGVTKAALYYHFKTKDEIVASLVEDRMAQIGELVEWAQGEPRTAATRRELLRRYGEMLQQRGHDRLMRFFERNQSSMNQHKSGMQMRGKMLELLDLLTDRDAPLADQIRGSLAIFALHSTWFVIRDPEISDEDRHAAALEVALSLVAPD